MKFFSKFLLILFGFFLSIGVLEIIFRIIIPASEMPFYTYDEEHNIRKFGYDNGTAGVRTMGVFAQIRAKWRINNHGWNSAIDYNFDKDSTKFRIAIIGDSFIEGLHINPDENVGHILNNLLGRDKFEVYTFAQSGWPLSAYLHTNRYIQSYYKPDLIVINIVHNDFDESTTFKGEKFHLLFELDEESYTLLEFPPQPPKYYTLVNRFHIFKKSALIRYLYYNLKIHYWLKLTDESKFEKKYIQPQESNTDSNITIQDKENAVENDYSHLSKEQIDSLDYRNEFYIWLNNIIPKFKEANEGIPFLFVMNASGNCGEEINIINILLEELANINSINYIDLNGAFQSACKTYKKANCNNVDRHWNMQGHRVAAQAIYDYIKTNNLIP